MNRKSGSVHLDCILEALKRETLAPVSAVAACVTPVTGVVTGVLLCTSVNVAAVADTDVFSVITAVNAWKQNKICDKLLCLLTITRVNVHWKFTETMLNIITLSSWSHGTRVRLRMLSSLLGNTVDSFASNLWLTPTLGDFSIDFGRCCWYWYRNQMSVGDWKSPSVLCNLHDKHVWIVSKIHNHIVIHFYIWIQLVTNLQTCVAVKNVGCDGNE